VDQREKGERLRALHEGEPFVIPNPWDVGSARVLEALGFEALATTSSGFAFTLGRPDGAATLDEVVEHVRLVAAATSVPLSVDLENGHGPDPGEAIRRVAEAGAVGGSIEDWDPEASRLYDRDEAAARVAAAAAIARDVGVPFVLTGRAENHIRGNPDLEDTIDRLQAYARAGADVVYAPGLRTADEIRAVCEAVDRPVNVLALPGFTRTAAFEAGAQRISVGGALAWVAAGALVQAAERLRDDGDFSVLRARLPLGAWLA
jgi:2-methylisocitrate lyase-like PEP mutase family enzyme